MKEQKKPGKDESLFKQRSKVLAITGQAIEKGKSLELELSPELTACLEGLPKEVYKVHFSHLIQTRPPNGVLWIIGTKKSALQALRGWRDEDDRKVREEFYIYAYPILYEAGQASLRSRGQEIVFGENELVLRALGESLPEEHKGVLGMIESMAESGCLDKDIELPSLQSALWHLWRHQIPESLRKSKLASCSPENLA